MLINRRRTDYILLLAVTGIVALSWVYLMYTTRLTGIEFLENRFGPIPTVTPEYLQNV